MSYDIKAIPILYNGVQYRSQLEAKWACFFELIGCPFEYEPFILDKWSPDFVLRPYNKEFLLEIKPQSEWNNDLINKMYRHCATNKCLLFHDEIYIYPDEVETIYLGKLFNQDSSKNLILLDFDLGTLLPTYSISQINFLWKKAKNEVQFLKPV